MLSSRVPANLEPNRLTECVRRARAAGRDFVDLTVTNPTRCGIAYPPTILRGLAGPEGLTYDPAPFGLAAARQAVAGDYARRGLAVHPDRIVLTSSTSEAYSLLFKLLCEPSGDRVAVPVPSYPLFDHLTRLDGVEAAPYRLEYHDRWLVDWSSVDAAWAARTRAVLAVSPNNPTGSTLAADELDEFDRRCAAAGAALIVDEVFADYPFAAPAAPTAPTAPSPPRALRFRLGGLSKSAGLPQVKLGWIAVEGPDEPVRRALDHLELICDTYLSVSTPVQVAAPELIAAGAGIRRQIQERVRANYATLLELVAAFPSVQVLHADAGWSAVLRVPARSSEDEMTMALLEGEGVLAHPGFFFDFPHEAFLVLSLLPEPAAFRDGAARVMDHVHV